jgi:Uma2 family endonuclease
MAHETQARPPGSLTVAEYLALETATGIKHDYVLGQVYALAGATEDHNRIALNIAAALLPGARAVGGRVVGSDQSLEAGDRLYYYPDVQVLCDPTDTDPLIKRRPRVVVEVVSDPPRRSTAAKSCWCTAASRAAVFTSSSPRTVAISPCTTATTAGPG